MELEFVKWLSERLQHHPPNRSANVRLAVGDDAAILDFADEHCVSTTDMLMDGTDFIVGQHSLERIGRKALAVNLSDVAAMGAEPVGALISFALPQDNALHMAQALINGMLPLAAEFGVAIIGGDTNCWRQPLVISVTLLARCPAGRALLRSGAVPGDRIIVTGTFGGSLQGKHLDFTPRLREALLLRDRYTIHAACDVSDGLGLDLWRVATASRCGAIIESQDIPLSDAVMNLYANDIQRARRHALSDGEDFELLLAVPSDDADRLLEDQPCSVPLRCIGEFTDASGLWLNDISGRRELAPLGYVHGGNQAT